MTHEYVRLKKEYEDFMMGACNRVWKNDEGFLTECVPDLLAEVKRLNELLNHINDLSYEVIDDYTKGNDILLAIHETTTGKITEACDEE